MEAGSWRRVLPTCVGMVRETRRHAGWKARSPHVRGDGPKILAVLIVVMAFSPRAWGWSHVLKDRLDPEVVLPTCVGMVRISEVIILVLLRSPHVRGDGPLRAMQTASIIAFSPRAWGWSEHGRFIPHPATVLPTCVGMVRERRNPLPADKGSPHVRGDGPT